ncbi:peptidase S8/S53 domain-containing protein [Rhodofomes roseus]|uniref:tripeptidyl-peptidase II n=1 Tax=Rhodofomes roseus TaxID=34475 RepID=A0ABQ8K305_9APHY|nr:peptidase S8/S53 domain-containing protein [Rhodofomes roseus]KAH9831173.1 peptidase S8/S53 domain-containing protein [Rhodofomes roseus]
MPFLIQSLVFFTFSLVATATVSPHIVHEKRDVAPSGWAPVRRAEANIMLPLRIGLAQPNLESLDDYLLEVSHPESLNYGKNWSPAKVAETFRPSAASIYTVLEWLEDEGLAASRVKLSQGGSWVHANVTVAEAEILLGTEYHVYQHSESGIEHLACVDKYHLPEHVAEHIDLVMPTLHFDVHMNRKRSVDKSIGQPGAGIVNPKLIGEIEVVLTNLTGCNKQITPDCLRALYDFDYTPVATDKNSIGIVEYTPVAYLPADMDMFFGNYSPSQVGQRPALVSIDGGYEQTSFQGFSINGEANLDLQYAMALVGATQNVTLYQVGDLVEGASFNNFLDALDASYCTYEGGDNSSFDGIYPDSEYKSDDCGTAPLTNIISTSYGYTESLLGSAYIQRQCYEYGKLGLMGVTFIFASGDNGVAGNGECLDANGAESYSGTRYNPGFPATCPYVTSVGATQISPGNTVNDPEVACDTNIYSGGGFSNVFGLPEWQADAVHGFLDNYPPAYAADVYNSSGISRAFPDIAVNGLNYSVVSNGRTQLVAGTSAAAPVAAAILSGVNDARLAVGKSPIGFINPTIYSSNFTGAWNDITSGNNPGCGTDGFSAQPGWDPVTGLGTPNFPKLRDLWLSMP